MEALAGSGAGDAAAGDEHAVAASAAGAVLERGVAHQMAAAAADEDMEDEDEDEEGETDDEDEEEAGGGVGHDCDAADVPKAGSQAGCEAHHGVEQGHEEHDAKDGVDNAEARTAERAVGGLLDAPHMAGFVAIPLILRDLETAAAAAAVVVVVVVVVVHVRLLLVVRIYHEANDPPHAAMATPHIARRMKETMMVDDALAVNTVDHQVLVRKVDGGSDARTERRKRGQWGVTTRAGKIAIPARVAVESA